MVILDGDEVGLSHAIGLVRANPNPAHLDEDRIVSGRVRSIDDIIDDSLAVSAVAAYAVRDGQALVGGVTFEPAEGLFKHLIWLLGSAGTIRFPRWLVREGRRMLDSADRFFKWPYGYVQAIPLDYRRGINFAEHMGLKMSRIILRDDGEEIAVMERMIP